MSGNHSSSLRLDFADVLVMALPVSGTSLGSPMPQAAMSADSDEFHCAGSDLDSCRMCLLEVPTLSSNPHRESTWQGSHSGDDDQKYS